MISLALRTIGVLYDITKVETVLDGWHTYLCRGAVCLGVANVRNLLHLLNTFAPEILKVPQAPIVFNVINDCCQVLLLLGTAKCLIH